MAAVRHAPMNGATQAHPSRRDNHSVSSTHSASRGDREGRRRGNPAVESAVTRLLVSIKQLLESLTLWSTQQLTETQVSDVYVRLGNDFNAAVAAFNAFRIDMTDLATVPDDLRGVLETCLAEDATPENLDQYLPQVRAIITNLLQGLRGKQSIYRRIVQDHRHGSSQSSSSHGHERTESRSSRSDRSSHREDEAVAAAAARIQHSRSLPNGDGERKPDAVARRSATSSSRRKQAASTLSQPPATADSDEPFVGGFAPPAPGPESDLPSLPPQPDRASAPVQSAPQRRTQPSTNSLPPLPAAPPEERKSLNGTPKPPEQATAEEERPETPSSPPPSQQAPAHMKRYSLVDKPMPPSVVIDEVSTPSPSEDVQMASRQGATGTPPPFDSPPLEPTPAVASSLAALQKSDALERRASKRFSSYNINKMTGAKSLGGAGNRRSMAVGSALTPGELAVLTEEGEEEQALEPSTGSFRRRSRAYRGGTSPIAEEPPAPPVPPLPSSTAPTPEPGPSGERGESPGELEQAAKKEGEQGRSSRSFPVFLQLGREVKKVKIEPGLSFSSLRVLFVDKFSYNPGLENFPAIYIRDPSSGVQYELEDVDEVKENCLLSLNIEPLDQIKQHIDAQITTLSQDIKDLRSLVSSNRRMSHPPPMIIGQPLGESTPPPNRPTDRQFQHVARRLSRLVNNDDNTLTPDAMQANMTGQSVMPQVTGGSVLSEYSNRVVADLKTQFDEVQNLRRDLGIMRQLYAEFMKQTKESLGTLRTQTANVRQLAAAKVGGARQYIDDGKTKLDMRSQNVLTKMEELQDLVENVKDDVLKRHVTPKPQVLRAIKDDVDRVSAELESLREHIGTIKPMWKKTWEEELQNIVEEQGFLNHQEEFLNDLLEDQKAVLEVYGHIEKVISLRGTGRPGSRGRLRPVNGGVGFMPPPAEEGHNGLSTVMLEIRNASVDPERRLKAIEASQKNRERELAKKGDEFEEELKGFVKGGKLRMTGGAEEAERVRKRRDEMALKAMFSGGSAGPSASGSGGES
ncbi:AIP3-domain-containing protein [Gloeophyllum trabeum ATCC 11539]|uniref:AIP3-domain-containing protein n=1 Tax=Gloeophyllum trabeum (strain ATCC 11539 / FP-39264 / Madison 617) TaxID=670483 RepID=S7Q9F8_GLOTA|nr:AIP3-domain-containing protein [Gloeophyllum trabeum ATCC 11539]EPQ56556.1 AIP3-domain-containing protein [Gloeophyllum trabeum ATCC 11539]